MFSKKPTIDVKKSIQKFLDVKRDSPTRFKHLKITLDHIDVSESKTLVETHFSQVFYVFYDTYTSVESSLRLKGPRLQREELEGVLPLLERILILVPELLHQRWHSHTLYQLFLRLLHPGNYFEIRRMAVRLFLLWYQALGDSADSGAHYIFKNIAPGFPSQHGQHLDDAAPLFPPPPGEKGPEDASQYYLDYLMEQMVKQVNRIEWRDKNYGRPQKCFAFLLQSFQRFYLPHIFPDLSKETNIYCPNLDINELKRQGPNEYNMSVKQPLLSCRAVVLKWLTNLTHVSQRSKESQSAFKVPVESGTSGLDTSFSSQASDKEHASVQNWKTSEQERRDTMVAQDVLFGTKENVNLVIEIYRQAFLLPTQYSGATRRVLSLYKDWIQGKVEMPVFMFEPRESEENEHKAAKEFSVRAGAQNTLQVFITHAAHVFLNWIPPQAADALEEQVDVCKRVLSIYRFMVMNTRMEQKTWEQLLLVLLQVTSQVLSEPARKKEDCLGNRLATALFQTLIVTWIRANLNVVVSVELWDQFVQVLSSLAVWEALVREWAKTMDTLTRILARHVYHLDLSDLPLDRLSEQKAKKRRAGQVEPPNRLNLPQPKTSSIVNRSQTTTPASTPTYPPPHHPASSISTKGQSSSSQGQDETKSATGSVRSRGSVSGTHHTTARSRRRHSSSGDTQLQESAFRRLPLVRSRSEGRLPQVLSPSLPRSLRGYISVAVPRIPANVENRITRMLVFENASTAQLLRRPLTPRRQQLRKKSRSADSIVHLRPSAVPYSDSECDSRSPSPAPSSGVETNSIKDSPIQIDMMGNDPGMIEGELNDESRSVMMGGKLKGWLPDVTAVMWKRMLGSLGDPNEGKQPGIHAAIFQYLVELGSVLLKIRQNQGVSLDNLSTPSSPVLVPPLFLLAPWCHKALLLPATYNKGKLYAMQLLCNITIQRHDRPVTRNHLLQFYRALHRGLLSDDQEMINTVIKHCGPRFFSVQLPGYSLLALDFLHGANTIVSSNDLKGSPRIEAVSLVGSLICFPQILPDLRVIQPTTHEFSLVAMESVKDQVVAISLKAAKREPTSVGRCVALSSLAIFIYSQLSHEREHPKIREAVSVLLAVLKHCVPVQPVKSSSASEFKNKAVAQVACDMLLLLCDRSAALLRFYPDLPRIIVEELSHTLFALAFGPTCNDQTKRLLLTLALCLGEWCMNLPVACLLESESQQSPSQILQTVFHVLNSVASGNMTPVRDQNSTEEEVDRAVDNIGEHLPTVTPAGTPSESPARESDDYATGYGRVRITTGENQENMKAVRLAAKMVMNHLVNHVGHFPMGIGASRLSSAVMEHDDLPGYAGEELFPDIFQSSSVQFFVLNSDTLMSLVELPALEAPGGRISSTFRTAKSQVRIILRDLGGKSCWDASVLYGFRDDSTLTRHPPNYRVTAEPVFQEQFLTSSFVGTSSELQPSPPRLSVRHRPTSTLPTWEDTADDMDNLDDLLLYIGATSPECIPVARVGETLASPALPPSVISAEVEEEVVNLLLQQKHTELDFVHRHCNDPWMKAAASEEPVPDDSQFPFQLGRMFFSQLGLTSWDKRGQVHLLRKSDKLLRELKNLDSQKCRETHKIAIIYVGEGQEDKNSILSNSGGSQGFEDFVAAMAWEVELEGHTGFMGGLQRNRSTGETAPYFATSFVEVVFHVSTRMPSHNQDALLQKMRHLGNDEVHIVWSEHNRDYRRGIIPTEFCDVLIVIYPLPNHLFRIQISRKPDVPFVGPLFNECIVDERILPGLVRATALNASRATRSMLPYYLTFYEERSKALENITQTLKEPTTFEDFCVQLCSPGLPLTSSSSSSGPSSSCYTSSLVDIPVNPASGPPSSSGHIASSDNSFGFPVNIFRHASDKQRGSDLTASGESEESSYTSPKASKRLSFKQATRKASAFGSVDC